MSDLIAKIQAAQRDAAECAVIAHLERSMGAQPAQAVPKVVNVSSAGSKPEDLFNFNKWVPPLLSDEEVDDILIACSQIPNPRRRIRAVEQAVRDKLGVGVAVPMTDEQVWVVYANSPSDLFEAGVRAAEKFHGIVGKEGA